MIRVRTLGAIDIRAADGTEIRAPLAQPKRFALLAYLLLARPRGPHRRDTLTALFWPEHDTEHARNALSQAVHFLRRAVGEELFERGRGDELSVRSDAASCDAIEFERAVAERRDAEALALYGGPFLTGLHVAEGSPELEQWIDDERSRLARSWADIVERAAIAAEHHGEHAAAATRWRQLASDDRLNSRIALRLMRALAAAGDPAGAIRHARAHEQLLRAEVDASPDVAISAFVDELRRPPTAAARTAATISAAAPDDPELPPPNARLHETMAVDVPRHASQSPGPPGVERRPLRARLAVVAAIALLAAATVALLTRHGKPRPANAALRTVASSLAVRGGDSAAGELYLRARLAWRSRNPSAVRQSILLYRQAIAHDSTFALAWAGLADSYRFYGGLNFGPIAPYMDSARVAVRHALALDSSLSQAHTMLASLYADAAEWPAAEREFQRAIAGDPRNALAHHWYAIVLATVNRRDEALHEIRRARALDSLSGPLNRALSQIETWAEVQDPTFAAPERRPIIDPAFKNDYADHARYDALVGQCARAAAEIRTAYELSPGDAMVAAADVHVHMRCGDRAGARHVLAAMKRAPDARLSTIYIAMAHTQFGELNSAFAWLEREQYGGMVKRFELRTSIYLTPLREDARYDSLLPRIGMAPASHR